MNNKSLKWLIAILIAIDLALMAIIARQLYAVWFVVEFIKKLA